MPSATIIVEHYNKWHMSTCGKKERHANYPKGKFWFLARRIRFDGQFNVYRDVKPATSTNCAEGIYFMEYAQISSGVEGALLYNS